VNDLINKPSHYHITVRGTEMDCLDVTEALGFNQHHYIASAFAYIWRCLRKGSKVDDLRKAIFYLQREVDRCSSSSE
jgi:hypothetical protein